jgi:acetyltransferase
LAARDPNTDGVLVILTPQAMTDATATAQLLQPLAQLEGKPLLASWMGGPAVDAGEALLNQANIPTFKYPDRAARAFAYMWQYSSNLRALYETPTLVTEGDETDAGRVRVDEILQKIRRAERTLLTEAESKQILASYGIPTVETRIALTESEAVAQAQEIGYPVAVKLLSETLTHKTDVGGVHLDVPTAGAVRKAWRAIESSVRRKAQRQDFLGVTVQPMMPREGYELILGSSIDPQFGPVLLFGAGGQLVEVFRDRALGLPPLNGTLARRLMKQARIYTALQGVRGRRPVDFAALEQALVRFSRLVAEQPSIAEIDINPLLVSPERLVALDARIVLHAPEISAEQLPRLAIRPYPSHYLTQFKLKNGTAATIRPIRPEDEPLIVRFHQTLSERSVYCRYFMPLRVEQRIAHERLARLCFIDYDREMALVVEQKNAGTAAGQILGVARLTKLHHANEAEFALLISDSWQNQGIGTRLLKMLVQIGRDEHLDRISATILPENREMQHVSRKAGFEVRHLPGENECHAEIVLTSAQDKPRLPVRKPRR